MEWSGVKRRGVEWSGALRRGWSWSKSLLVVVVMAVAASLAQAPQLRLGVGGPNNHREPLEQTAVDNASGNAFPQSSSFGQLLQHG